MKELIHTIYPEMMLQEGTLYKEQAPLHPGSVGILMGDLQSFSTVSNTFPIPSCNG